MHSCTVHLLEMERGAFRGSGGAGIRSGIRDPAEGRQDRFSGDPDRRGAGRYFEHLQYSARCAEAEDPQGAGHGLPDVGKPGPGRFQILRFRKQRAGIGSPAPG